MQKEYEQRRRRAKRRGAREREAQAECARGKETQDDDVDKRRAMVREQEAQEFLATRSVRRERVRVSRVREGENEAAQRGAMRAVMAKRRARAARAAAACVRECACKIGTAR